MPDYAINKAIMMGDMETEPKLRLTQTSFPVCYSPLATYCRQLAAGGQWHGTSDWHNINLGMQKADIARHPSF